MTAILVGTLTFLGACLLVWLVVVVLAGLLVMWLHDDAEYTAGLENYPGTSEEP